MTASETPHRPSNQQPHPSLRARLEYLFVQEKDPAYVFLILGGLTVIGLVLRLLEINRPIAYDEAYTFVNFASKSFKYILADYSAPNNHIFHTILVGIAYRLFGGQPWVVRLPAFLAGTLMAPVMYFTARRFFGRAQALAASALVAAVPVFIDYSVNGRGYTLIFVLALLLANFAAIVVTRPDRSALIAFGLTAALGFYTIPIFLYPMAGVSLWVAATYLFAKETWQTRLRRLTVFLLTCLLAGLLTLLLYSPVILFGTGLSSLVGNQFVKSQGWSAFAANLAPRLSSVWDKWTIGLPAASEYLLLGGFLLSLFFSRKVSKQKLPLPIFLALALALLLAIQQVTPTPRIWLYLEVFYLMFAAAGLVWLTDWLARRWAQPALAERMLSFAILLVFLGVFASSLIVHQRTAATVDSTHSPEEYTADYLADHLRPEDTLIATGPVDIETAYYLSQHGISFDRFYKRDHPVPIRNALVLVRKKTNYETPESVVKFFKLDQALDLSAAELVFEYASVQVYSVPVKQ